MQKGELKKILDAMSLIESDRKVDHEILIEALKEAIDKAYRKQSNLSDVNVRVDISEATGIKAYHLYNVVEDVEDFEFEVSLEDARLTNPEAQIGDVIEKQINIKEFDRSAAVLAKNVVRQKIREAEKKAVYDEYIDLLDEMVLGIIETVEENHIIVNLGKTFAIMTKNAQMPNERYVEGQKIRVVITECNKEFKGAQVKVSRADARLVRRLFEKEIPEIYQGLIEIKAIAREAGERTKVAVYSKNQDVDARGACIGPRGSRVQSIMQELHGEKIEIFEWNDDLGQLIDNTFAPAVVRAAYYTEDNKRIVVVVDDSQLSIAIGKKGSNAKLASRLLNLKIDIKPLSEIEKDGVDIEAKKAEFNAILRARVEEKEAKALEARNKAIEEAKQLREQAKEETGEVSDEDYFGDINELEAEVEEVVVIEHTPVVDAKEEVIEEVVEIPAVEEEIIEEAEEEKIEAIEEVKVVKKRKELKPKTEYVSKLEKLATAKTVTAEKIIKKRKNKDEEERRIRAKDLLKDRDYVVKPEYSEEELLEIENAKAIEQANSWIEDDEIDFDEYEDYYDQEV